MHFFLNFAVVLDFNDPSVLRCFLGDEYLSSKNDFFRENTTFSKFCCTFRFHCGYIRFLVVKHYTCVFACFFGDEY